MLIGGVDTDERVVVVAEIGNSHGGDSDRARRQIDWLMKLERMWLNSDLSARTLRQPAG